MVFGRIFVLAFKRSLKAWKNFEKLITLEKRIPEDRMKKRLIIGVMVLLAVAVIVVLIKRTGNGRDQGVIAASGNVEVTEVNRGIQDPRTGDDAFYR